jgi:hypothetical protein
MQISASGLPPTIFGSEQAFIVRGRAAASSARPAATLTDVAVTQPEKPTLDAPVVTDEPEDAPAVKVKLKTKVTGGHHAHAHDKPGHLIGKGHQPRMHIKLMAGHGGDKLHVNFKQTLDEDAAATISRTLRDEVESYLTGADSGVNGDAVRALLDAFELALDSDVSPAEGAEAFDAESFAARIEDALAAFASGLEAILLGENPIDDSAPTPPLLIYEPAPDGIVVIPEIDDKPTLDPDAPLSPTGIDILA